MVGKTYWKDLRQSFSTSKGRVLSIVSLMALGSFALIGLKVSEPDIRTTGEDFFREHQTADLFVISNYGLDSSDTKILDGLDDEATVEYGYFKDVVVKDSTSAFRLFSKPETLSTYDLVEGKLPTKRGEIALSAAYQDDYKIGDTIDFTEKAGQNGEKVLKDHSYKIVGFVNSSELLSRVNLGQTTAGSGELNGYGVVTDTSFDSDVYMIARVAYDDLRSISPYEQTYIDQVYEDKKAVAKLLENQPSVRLAELKEEGQKTIDEGYAKITAAKKELSDAKAQLNQAQAHITDQENQLNAAKAVYGAAAVAEQDSQLQAAKVSLAEKTKAYQTKKAQADQELAEKEAALEEAQDSLDDLEQPTYETYTRREIPGSEGYVSYENNASVIDAVGNIFPVVLYFIAALVTFTTMARFVDEERLKAGTLKALGYDNRSIVRKFVLYGFVTSMIGTAIGTLAGHLLLPSIIYSTYASKLVVAPIELHFYPVKTLLAILLGLLSSVVPALLVVRKELAEKPAQLLLPKPPASGSKILMERITPIWSRMSFTQKVTARNIFRYKQRMLMTIFGVCGSIALLFAGLGVRSSIADLNNRQFNDIIKYDMIVAENNHLSSSQEKDLNQLLNSDDVKSHLSVHYETLTKVAGDNNDEQSITTLVTDGKDDATFRKYINLVNRTDGKALHLDQDGVVISEKLADLTGVKVGDTLTVKNADGKSIKLNISGIAEMYMSHFIFMSQDYYEKAFGTSVDYNADLLMLKDDSTKNTNAVATDFMDLAAVKGVVQNTTLKEQVNTIVDSLNRVMYIMIITSVLLAVVILYNLTNVNVAERIRELSTIKVLGFYDKEVTMYIYRETMHLSLIGILVGFGMGYALHSYMLLIIPPDTVMFNPAVGWLIYVVPAGVVILILIILGIIVNQWLKKIDMLEALKSVE